MSLNRKELKVKSGRSLKKNPNIKKTKKANKGIITDPMGQWAHPGKNTRIPGNDITMQGVDYPVWAVPSTGQPVMMQPGGNYNFPGASYVDEFPQMQSGGPIPPTVQAPQLDSSILQTAITQVASKNSVGINGTPDVNISSFDQIYPELRNAVKERYNALIQTKTSQMQNGGVPFNQQAYDDSLQIYNSTKRSYDETIKDFDAGLTYEDMVEKAKANTKKYKKATGKSFRDLELTEAINRLTSLNKERPQPNPAFPGKPFPSKVLGKDLSLGFQFHAPVDYPKSKGTTDPNLSVAVNLRKRGMDSSFAARKQMATDAGIENYKGTADQNIALNKFVFANYEGSNLKTSQEQSQEQSVVPESIGTLPIKEINPFQQKPIVTSSMSNLQLEQTIPEKSDEPRIMNRPTIDFSSQDKPSTLRPLYKQNGGAQEDYEEMELTDDQIAKFRAQGIRVELL